MRLNGIEFVVVAVILICSVVSIAHSFLDYVAPQSIQEQRAQMEPTIEMFQAYNLGERVRK